MIWLLIFIGVAYDWLTTFWLYRWLQTAIEFEPKRVPVTIFRPIKPDVAGLELHIRDFLAAIEPEDQVLFGIYADDLFSREILARFPQVQVVECQPNLTRNPKINKLLQLTPFAHHDHWLVLDSEVENHSEFLPSFRSEWARLGHPVLSAPYRFRELTLSSAPVLHTLLPGIAVLRHFGKIAHTLGACVALTRSHVAQLGGWESLGNFLAEDHELGHRLAAQGVPVAYARSVVQLANDRPSLHSTLRYLHRLSVTYRVCQPWGFAGTLITQVVFWSLLGFNSWAFALTCLSRVLVCQLRARKIGWPLPFWKSLLILPVSSLLETVFWLLAWLPLPVIWAGRRWKNTELQPAHGLKNAASENGRRLI